jgi:hypothetical protein
VFALSSTVRCVSTASGRSSRSTAATLQLGSDIESNALLLHRRNRLSTSSTVMPTIVVSESASQAISSAVTAVARAAALRGDQVVEGVDLGVEHPEIPLTIDAVIADGGGLARLATITTGRMPIRCVEPA